MRITKLVHSCLLVETDSAVALFDPGSFSKDAVLTQLEQLDRLDYLVITHNHQDHLDEELIREIKAKWSSAKLAANEQITKQLSELAFETAGEALVEFEAPHEKLPAGNQVPQNSGWHFGDLSHPGDSLRFSETKKVLALPYVAPWGSTTQAVELAKELKPEYIIPIHDWHLNDEARTWYRRLLESALKPAGTRVLNMENGIVEI